MKLTYSYWKKNDWLIGLPDTFPGWRNIPEDAVPGGYKLPLGVAA
jgi:hypothetical protein